MPREIRVHLLESRKPLNMVLVKAPFSVKSPGHAARIFSAGSYSLSVEKGTIIVRPSTDHNATSADRTATTADRNATSADRNATSADRTATSADRNATAIRCGSSIELAASSSNATIQLSVAPPIFRCYEGRIFVRTASTRLSSELELSNVVSPRSYVESVVASESLPEFPLEALKAQSVLTLSNLSSKSGIYKIGDSTQSEFYGGANLVSANTKLAVREVWNQSLTYKGKTIKPFYHSCCAGKTSPARDVFGAGATNMPFLTCRPCEFCRKSPFWKTTETSLDKHQFALAFHLDESKGLPTVEASDCAGRPSQVRLHLANGRSKQISGYEFWIALGQKFGWDKAPGSRFSLQPSKDGKSVVVASTGAGHGVGLCQWGAAAQASAGKNYKQILAYYFPGTELVRSGR